MAHAGDPTEVVHPTDLEHQLWQWGIQHASDHFHQRYGRIASADHVDCSIAADGVLDDAAGIGQVEQSAVRGEFFQRAADFQGDRDAAHGVGKAAWTNRLFAGDAELARKGLVEGAAFQPANPHLVDHVIHTLQAVFQAGG